MSVIIVVAIVLKLAEENDDKSQNMSEQEHVRKQWRRVGERARPELLQPGRLEKQDWRATLLAYVHPHFLLDSAHRVPRKILISRSRSARLAALQRVAPIRTYFSPRAHLTLACIGLQCYLCVRACS
jgi:hypothetical protein